MSETERNWGAEDWRAPTVNDGDTLLFSECGRVVAAHTYGHDRDAIDYRSHYFRVVKRGSGAYLLVKHGGGEERFQLDYNAARVALFFKNLDSTERYLLMHTFHRVAAQARNAENLAVTEKYKRAFIEGKLKKRKARNSNSVKVWIENGG